MNAGKNLTGEVVVVTGASAGVGRAVARAFASAGADIALLARGTEGLEDARAEVVQLGRRAIALAVDVGDAVQVEEAAARIEAELGPVAVWVNNAMVSVFSPLKEITAEEFNRVTAVTYLGQVYGTMAALKRMLPRNSGVIVLVGSALAYRGIPLQSAYCGAKHGIEGFFDSLRCELIHDKSRVRAVMVQLPAMNTPQFGWVKTRLPRLPKPMGKIYQPEIAARAIVYAALHKRRSVWVGAPTFASIIGNRIAPGFLDRVLARSGYDGQQTAEPAGRDRKERTNLWTPLPGDEGAHGTFGREAAGRSPLLWVSMHRNKIDWAICLTVIIVLIFIFIY
ncbi:SDR family oxidoreductase [Compostibacter hankyongensis]|uniref:SDR family oxidoreductase n=1 Tax=Compostibacter hankyongensis TaxID=1007089 RepID=A0ABP8FYX8_9BACT